MEKNRDVCVSGCNFAKKEVDNIMEVRFFCIKSKNFKIFTDKNANCSLQMSHHLLEEAEKQMNFLNSIIGMVSSTFWSTEDNENGKSALTKL